MGIAIDQANLGGEFASDTSGATAAFTTTVAAAANTLIVVAVSNLTSTAPQLASVSGGGLTWSVDKTVAGGSASGTSIASAQAPSGLASGTTITATFTGTPAGARSIMGMSFTGIKTASAVGVTDGHSNALGTAWTTDSMTISPGSVIVAMAMNTTNLFTSTPTAPAVEASDFGSGGFSQTTVYLIDGGSGGATTVAGTWSTAANSETVAVEYLAAPAVPSPPPPVLIMAPRIAA